MVAAKSNVNVKIDSQVKERAAQLLEKMGLDQTTAIDMFYRKIIAEQRLPFQPVATSNVDERLLALISQSNIPVVTLEADEDGNLLLDKDLHPSVYDWVVHG